MHNNGFLKLINKDSLSLMLIQLYLNSLLNNNWLIMGSQFGPCFIFLFIIFHSTVFFGVFVCECLCVAYWIFRAVTIWQNCFFFFFAFLLFVVVVVLASARFRKRVNWIEPQTRENCIRANSEIDFNIIIQFVNLLIFITIIKFMCSWPHFAHHLLLVNLLTEQAK